MTDPQLEPRSFQPLFDDLPYPAGYDGSRASDPWDAVRSSALIHRVRWHTGLSQIEFAQAFQIDPEYLQALERGAVQPDSALVAYLTVIDREPALVRAALQTS